MPSHVGTMSLDSTGIVPSLDETWLDLQGPLDQALPAHGIFCSLDWGPEASTHLPLNISHSSYFVLGTRLGAGKQQVSKTKSDPCVPSGFMGVREQKGDTKQVS